MSRFTGYPPHWPLVRSESADNVCAACDRLCAARFAQQGMGTWTNLLRAGKLAEKGVDRT